MEASILSYRVTKTFGRRNAANFMSSTFTARGWGQGQVTRIGPRKWELSIVVKDTDLELVKEWLQTLSTTLRRTQP